MTKVELATMKEELASLKALIAALKSEPSPKVTKKQRSKGTAKLFKVSRDVAKSEKHGVEYCIVEFLGVKSKADMTDVQLDAMGQIKAARWGSKGMGKFRFNGSAWTGQTAYVPAIVKNNS